MAIPEAFHPVALCSECQIRYQHGTNNYENGFAYKWSGSAPSAAELLALATELGGSLAVRMAGLMHNGVKMREVYCRNINTEVANQATWTAPVGFNGSQSGNPVASNEAANLVKRTGLTGRSKHGANRFSEFTEGNVDGNTLGSFIITQLASIAISVLASRVGARFAPALASRKLGTAELLLNALTLDDNVDSQKTRLNNHGR